MSDKLQLLSQLIEFERFPISPAIDLRSESEYCLGHFTGASHFKLDQVIERLFELPKNTQPLRLIGSHKQLEQAYDLLTNKGYQISATLSWTDELAKYLISQNLLDKGQTKYRLWSPAALVENFQTHFLDQEVINKVQNKALDLACGAGRDAVYLAMQGWQVDVIDYLPDALSKVKILAKRHGVTIKCLKLDLEKETAKFQQSECKYHLILVSRYLHRPLLPLLKEKLESGGYIVYQTFLQGCEKFGSPKNPRFLLAPGELAEVFSSFKVLLDEVDYLADGRPTNIFIAQNI